MTSHKAVKHLVRNARGETSRRSAGVGIRTQVYLTIQQVSSLPHIDSMESNGSVGLVRSATPAQGGRIVYTVVHSHIIVYH